MSPGPSSDRPDRHGFVFESTDPERTEAFFAAAFGTATKISATSGSYRFRLARQGSEPFQLSTIDHAPTTDSRADALPDHLVVVRMHRGVMTNVRADDHLGPGDVAVYSQPAQPIHTRVADARFTSAIIPIQAIEDAAYNRPDDEFSVLRFHSLRPTDRAATRRWLRTVDYITENMLSDDSAASQPLLMGAATRLVAAALLTTFPNSWRTETDRHERTDATPTTLARVIAFIEGHAGLDISTLDMARAAYVTVRAVQLAFRRQLDTTPTKYLRRVRLERAHQALHAANTEDGTTVRAVAERWGFLDPSRFAALYRRTYGQLPSHTLRN